MRELGGEGEAWLQGLKIVVAAVVANALWGMGKSLAPDRPRITIAILAAVLLLIFSGVAMQLAVIAAGALLGLIVLQPESAPKEAGSGRPTGYKFAVFALVLFFVLLAGLPMASRLIESQALAAAESFYRSGSLVFGGGHVVLPLLQAEVVNPGWVTNQEFVAGYGAAQAIPGPLFTFAAYLGTVMGAASPAWLGGLLTLAAIFLPSFLLVLGVLPLWDRVRSNLPIRKALMGVNAAVVGILLAALYDPVFVSAIATPADFAIAAVAFVLLSFWNVPPWLVVLLTAGVGALMQFVL